MFFLKIKRIFHDFIGSVSILSAIIFPIILIVTGIIVELSNILYVKEEIRSILDRSLLYTASQITGELSSTTATPIARDVQCKIKDIWQKAFYNELYQNGFAEYVDDLINSTSFSVVSNYINKSYNLIAVSRHRVPFKFYNFASWYANRVNSGHNLILITSSLQVSLQNDVGLDMMIVLDVSRSMMNYLSSCKKKIDLAKECIHIILNSLKCISDVKNVVRTGLVTFAEKIMESIPLDWGIKHLKRKMDNFNMGYSTNSTPGLEYAYNQIFGLQTQRIFLAENSYYKKFIIFVTDGDNSREKENEKSLYYCNEAKKKGAIIYSVGIRVLKARDFLKKCASPDQFYFVEDSNSMHDAFLQIGNDMTEKRIWYDK
ncbi:VWA domain-containing protein [Candidatus Liberibacter africanus]|uniref:VWFA domain-containing protein n=1 Tax=Candidatus Liberibacter africanus PTSAPSY TaxID=1277257 RepID=A0A0G3I366_LIBAF|nr:VWA domain-containing protein [Candidatus Liberibacter africanus]AKK19665.1 hypothetical protein G293_00005 [Candidatus Liberibacter africanus PTSAPSY]QTP63556.1 VWA domain-containing protein [Candidatus Liberibacter africanus]